MCGIVTVLPVYGDLDPPLKLAELLADLPEPPAPTAEIAGDPDGAEKYLTTLLEQVETLLSGLGTAAAAALLFSNESVRRAVSAAGTRLLEWADELDQRLDAPAAEWDAETVETVQDVLRQLGDRLYGVLQDRVTVAERARALAPGEPTLHAAISYHTIETVLAALDRLEVRGRDSAGSWFGSTSTTRLPAYRSRPDLPTESIRSPAAARLS